MFLRVLCPYATLMKGIIFILPLRNLRDQSFREERQNQCQPLTTVMVLNNVRKCLNIAQGMSTAGTDYTNIMYSKFRNIFYFLLRCLEKVLQTRFIGLGRWSTLYGVLL